MKIYLLAANLFALAALLIGSGSFFKSSRPWRLLPLFLLVVSRSLGLVIFLVSLKRGQPPILVSALEVWSALWLAWFLSTFPSPRSKLIWLAAGGGLLLALPPLFSGWPIPAQIHGLLIAIFGALLILIRAEEVRWLHLATLLVLALANFLNLFDFISVSWFLSLLAYVFLINAVHKESWQIQQQAYRERQKAAETLAQEAIDLSRERQRWFEVSELISAAPNLSQSMEHIVRSMAQVTHTDQAAIFILDVHHKGQARLVTLYSPKRPVHIAQQGEIIFTLEQCPPLQMALESQQTLLLPQKDIDSLHKLYDLWQENRGGPTLIQPLLVQSRPVGALMLGNPVTSRPIRASDMRLCQSLAPQIATLVEHRRRYLELETQAEAIQKQVSETGEHLVILETISDGLVLSDTTGRIQMVNKAAERILSKPHWDLIGQPIGTIYQAITPHEAPEDLTNTLAQRTEPLPTFIETEERAIQGQFVPWRNQDNEWLGTIAIFRDVTRELKADRARNDFIAALSHELRAPLTVIKGYSDLISKGEMGYYSPDQLRVQQIIQTSTDRMAAILDNAIQIMAQNRRKLLPRFEQIDIVRIIDEVLEEITPLAQLHELQLTRDIKTPLPPLTADPKHIRRILNNLLTNACHFTPPGGRVALRAWMQTEQKGNLFQPQLLLAVADNGVGIPPTEQQRIFDPFYQLRNYSITGQSGMGMGLAVVKELVELHNGRIWVESVPGEGSLFQVTLPLTQ